MICQMTNDLLLIDACISVYMKTRLRHRLKGSYLLVVFITNCPSTIIYTIGYPWCMAHFWKAEIPKEWGFISTGIAQASQAEKRQEIG